MALPDFTTQSGSTYKTNIDGTLAAITDGDGNLRVESAFPEFFMYRTGEAANEGAWQWSVDSNPNLRLQSINDDLSTDGVEVLKFERGVGTAVDQAVLLIPVTFEDNVIFTDVFPEIFIVRSGAASNEKAWRWSVDSSPHLILSTIEDDLSAGAVPVLKVLRGTGTAVDGVQFLAPFFITEPSEGADEKTWRIYVGVGGNLVFRAYEDDLSTAGDIAMNFIRGTGDTVSEVQFPTGDINIVNGDIHFSGGGTYTIRPTDGASDGQLTIAGDSSLGPSIIFYGGFSATKPDSIHIRTNAGVVVEGPTEPIGGAKGIGSINAKAVYDDNVLLGPDYVLEYIVDGFVDIAAWNKRSPAEQTEYKPAVDFIKQAAMCSDIEAFTAFWREHKHLPAFLSTKDWTEDVRPSHGEICTLLIETTECLAVHNAQLLERVKKLEKGTQK